MLVAKYYPSLSTLGTSGVLLFVGLLSVIVKADKYISGSAAVVVGAMILVPVGVSAAAYLISQLEGSGDAGMAMVALAVITGGLAFPAAIMFILYVVNLGLKVESRSLAQVLAKATNGRLPRLFSLLQSR